MPIVLNGTTGITTPTIAATSASTFTGALALPAGGLNVGSGQLAVDASGRVTMPFQPCFSARASGSGTNPGSNQTLPFTTVDVNTGSHYNTATSTFTAPIAGRYFFYFQVLTNSTSARAIANIMLNGAQHVEGSASAEFFNSLQAQVVITLAAGDAVRIQTGTADEGTNFFGNGSNQNWFMGYLIG